MQRIHQRWFRTQIVPQIKRNKLPPRPKFTPDLEPQCVEAFMHGGRGPGGQKINKTNSKVELRHIPTGIVVKCQETRSRERNRQIAREKMAYEIQKYNNNGISERDISLKLLHSQNKRSKAKKSKEKYAKHNLERELMKRGQELEDMEVIKKMASKE
ncbi:hypothetical protein KAFR_0A04930 [Kazachstania africana CBS 2517]|uniref:Prokaryotic-type class I peptide chain release factors domain-containing protein n=1 Tax=Kazachstania africana (strain ATCC 22294 / BCRC 22015 / CBS 2517 / CECT 1963 / NBRC 1671 / NRRL Y-8276) TaxID=1071382 RepID=H2ANH9_KAZAF|nr:hypothetical protein KAFR_0A04930 [Kazachstania africana CBS 2517]CCF55929.1 hypothetical protein KAFR_0A04930 [Kazachstania africana CBS 2517]